MAERKMIRLHEHDLIAGAQILSWVAMPHRPDDGANLMQQWFFARRRFRGEQNPPLPFKLKKRSRIEPQLAQFHARCLDGFRAGRWFDRQLLRGPNVVRGPISDGFGTSIHKLATGRTKAKGINPKEAGTGNAVRDIWSRRKPVAHLASAVRWALEERHEREDRHDFDLERTVFMPDWIAEVIERAESKATMAIASGIFRPKQLHKFHRDTF